jgi:hypothetical protein
LGVGPPKKLKPQRGWVSMPQNQVFLGGRWSKKNPSRRDDSSRTQREFLSAVKVLQPQWPRKTSWSSRTQQPRETSWPSRVYP